jgi:hypothetical protein
VRFAPEIGTAIGCDPHADVCLTMDDGARRIWIEFEISRADPVANHVKFAVAHGFVPQRSGDAFVSMVSSHVAVGRRSLASAAILLMRHVGMSAFQTLLLPRVAPAEVAALNGLSAGELRRRKLPIGDEIDRVLRIVDAVSDQPRYRIHFAADVGEVLMNARRWNNEIATEAGRALWHRKKRRAVQYFVYDPYPHSPCFAPSKFCAFVPIPREPTSGVDVRTTGFASAHLMGMALYAELDESEPRFDGYRARQHLERGLQMVREPLHDRHPLRRAFNAWSARHADVLGIRGTPEVLLLPASLR